MRARITRVAPYSSESAVVLATYSQAKTVALVREEPRTKGAWRFMATHASDVPPGLRYVGRPERASAAEGCHAAHQAEQARIVAEAFAQKGCRTPLHAPVRATEDEVDPSRTRTQRWHFRLDAEFGHRDVTDDVERLVAESGVRNGMVVVSLTGSTGAVTTIEYESGALADLRRALDLLAPANDDYAHNARWGDGNGYSHVRSALLKTSLAVPVVDGRLQLGTWQQIVVINLDSRAREREVVAVVVGAQ